MVVVGAVFSSPCRLANKGAHRNCGCRGVALASQLYGASQTNHRGSFRNICSERCTDACACARGAGGSRQVGQANDHDHMTHDKSNVFVLARHGNKQESAHVARPPSSAPLPHARVSWTGLIHCSAPPSLLADSRRLVELAAQCAAGGPSNATPWLHPAFSLSAGHARACAGGEEREGVRWGVGSHLLA